MGDTCAYVFIGDIDDDSLILIQELVLAHLVEGLGFRVDDSLILIQELVLAHLVEGLGFRVDDSLIHIQELVLAHPRIKPHAAQAMFVY
jgi:hypothetical protein